MSEGGKLTTHDGKTVTDLFPEFRPGQVLRFSRLFGPAKASSMPQQWRNAKKRKKKKKKQEDEKPVIEPPKSPPSPRPEDCMSDDEVIQYFGILYFLASKSQDFELELLRPNNIRVPFTTLCSWSGHFIYTKPVSPQAGSQLLVISIS